jgi:hypothetical protein
VRHVLFLVVVLVKLIGVGWIAIHSIAEKSDQVWLHPTATTNLFACPENLLVNFVENVVTIFEAIKEGIELFIFDEPQRSWFEPRWNSESTGDNDTIEVPGRPSIALQEIQIGIQRGKTVD